VSLLFPGDIEVYCTARVGDQELIRRQMLPRAVWEDPAAREVIEKALRYRLVEEILRKWTPVVKVRRG
jgi:hypothetical protein